MILLVVLMSKKDSRTVRMPPRLYRVMFLYMLHAAKHRVSEIVHTCISETIWKVLCVHSSAADTVSRQLMHTPLLQDKEQALKALAAAAVSSRPAMSAEEKQTLRAAGRAAEKAAQAKLTTQLEETDAAVQQMDDDRRGQWFQVRLESHS